jgi:hypothetical protein
MLKSNAMIGFDSFRFRKRGAASRIDGKRRAINRARKTWLGNVAMEMKLRRF